MEAKEKGVIMDAKAEAFLADVECTAHYDDSLAITTTTAFEVSHKDAYDSDVDEAPHAAATFMANLTGISTGEGTSNDTNFHLEVHTHNNHFFENVNHQVTQAMHQEEQLDSNVDSDIDDYDNIIPYHQYQSNTKVKNVPTKLKEQLKGKDNIIGKLKAYINNMKDSSTCPSLSTLEIDNTQFKEELTAVRIKNDSLRDENVSIKVINNTNVKQVWKVTGKVFASVGFRWKPTGRKFTLDNTCPLTRITKPEVVSLENSGSVRTSEPTNNVTVTPRFSEKTLTSYKHKDRNTKDTSTGSPSNIETMAAKYPVIVYPLPI
uniref:Uncharacterized protein n=1 Tax=Tanacetum cinerariifolium TaxID=118510 RepID=A0A6L2LVT3_TANCI|nr:hypothetical protein [Tanacetum cinerariifolium]